MKDIKNTIIALLVCVMLFSGCASNSPSPEMMAWARQEVQRRQQAEIDAKYKESEQAAELQRLKAENDKIKAAHAMELQQLKAENDKVKAAAEGQKNEIEMRAWFSENKPKIIERLTKYFQPQAQPLLEAYGFKGKAVAYWIQDADYEDNVLYFQQIIAWGKSDDSGGCASINTGLNIKTEKFVYDKIDKQADLTSAELKSIMNGDKEETQVIETEPARQSDGGFYKRNQPEMDHAAINVGEAAAKTAAVVGTTIIVTQFLKWFFSGEAEPASAAP